MLPSLSPPRGAPRALAVRLIPNATGFVVQPGAVGVTVVMNVLVVSASAAIAFASTLRALSSDEAGMADAFSTELTALATAQALPPSAVAVALPEDSVSATSLERIRTRYSPLPATTGGASSVDAPSIAVIAGAATGGAVVLCACAVLALLALRRRRVAKKVVPELRTIKFSDKDEYEPYPHWLDDEPRDVETEPVYSPRSSGSGNNNRFRTPPQSQQLRRGRGDDGSPRGRTYDRSPWSSGDDRYPRGRSDERSPWSSGDGRSPYGRSDERSPRGRDDDRALRGSRTSRPSPPPETSRWRSTDDGFAATATSDGVGEGSDGGRDSPPESVTPALTPRSHQQQSGARRGGPAWEGGAARDSALVRDAAAREALARAAAVRSEAVRDAERAHATEEARRRREATHRERLVQDAERREQEAERRSQAAYAAAVGASSSGLSATRPRGGVAAAAGNTAAATGAAAAAAGKSGAGPAAVAGKAAAAGSSASALARSRGQSEAVPGAGSGIGGTAAVQDSLARVRALYPSRHIGGVAPSAAAGVSPLGARVQPQQHPMARSGVPRVLPPLRHPLGAASDPYADAPRDSSDRWGGRSPAQLQYGASPPLLAGRAMAMQRAGATALDASAGTGIAPPGGSPPAGSSPMRSSPLRGSGGFGLGGGAPPSGGAASPMQRAASSALPSPTPLSPAFRGSPPRLRPSDL